MDPEIIPDTEVQNIPLTQDVVQSKIRYAWAVLFENNVNEPKPFSIVRLRDFVDTNFPWSSFSGEMTSESRIKLHSFSTIPEKCFHIFAKIEYGIVFWIILPIKKNMCG